MFAGHVKSVGVGGGGGGRSLRTELYLAVQLLAYSYFFFWRSRPAIEGQDGFVFTKGLLSWGSPLFFL